MSKFKPVKYEADGCLLEVSGVLFEADSPSEAIHRYRQGETVFWDGWRGSFCGVLRDEKNGTTLLFNDHIGSKMLFYAQTVHGFFYGRDLRELSQLTGLRTPDEVFIRAILEKGCTDDDRTFISGIRRLTAGQYLCVKGQEVQLTIYHRFDNTPWPYDEPKMLAETDRLFRQAVTRVIRKNEAEGLEHFFPLSGGLDSRMCQWIAHQIATQPIRNFTYSQTGHFDHLLPKEISRTLGNDWLFMPLDGGAYLTDIDAVCAESQWLINYMGPIEIATFARQQDWSRTGVVLTGVNGDNIFATETDNAHEMARIYTQGFNGNSLGSPLILQQYTESYSPFCDVDVLDFVLHVPTAKRRNYYFYDRWILTCYPQAAQWHHKHAQIGHRAAMVTIAGRNIPLRDVPKRIVMSLLRRLHIYDAYREDGESMHPYEIWLKQNPQIAETITRYYTTHKHLLDNTPFRTECERMMRIGSMMEKGKVLTVLSALKAFSDTGSPTK
ncbi:MAG: hypothetical protein IKP39_01745 [Paludibacteraceae bacterium]|nr:hypothetical protein [Paludibacteraceae bacterium]